MASRVGMSRQQYQRLESKGNPRLDTLMQVAEGLNCQLMLIPQEKVETVSLVVESHDPLGLIMAQDLLSPEKPTSDDPWRGLLGDDE